MERIIEFLMPVFPVLITLSVVLIWFLWQKRRTWRNRKNPQTRVMAEVVDRRAVSYRSGYGVRAHQVSEYHVTFRPVGGGETVEFSVSETEYSAYHLGDCGPLTYRTWEFISFRPERRGAERNSIPVAFADEETEK